MHGPPEDKKTLWPDWSSASIVCVWRLDLFRLPTTSPPEDRERRSTPADRGMFVIVLFLLHNYLIYKATAATMIWFHGVFMWLLLWKVWEVWRFLLSLFAHVSAGGVLFFRAALLCGAAHTARRTRGTVFHRPVATQRSARWGVEWLRTFVMWKRLSYLLYPSVLGGKIASYCSNLEHHGETHRYQIDQLSLISQFGEECLHGFRWFLLPVDEVERCAVLLCTADEKRVWG